MRYISLAADATGEPPEMCIRQGLTSTLHFDSKRVRFELEKKKFLWVLAGENALTFVPSESLRDGERLPLTVYFEDGAAPERATFELVVHPSHADRQVEVSRHPRPVASYRQEVRQAREEARQCQQEKAQLQAECRGRTGLTGLLAHRLVSREGVPSRDLSKEITGHLEDPLYLIGIYSYRSTPHHHGAEKRVVRLAVEVELMNTGTEPWEVAGAALIGPTGETLRVLETWQQEPIAPGKSRHVVVEVEATEQEARGPFTLKLWAGEEDGRNVTLRGVTFP